MTWPIDVELRNWAVAEDRRKVAATQPMHEVVDRREAGLLDDLGGGHQLLG